MATGDYHSLPLDFKVTKRRRTERRYPSPLSDSGLTQDENECILALLDLSRAPLIHDEEMTPAGEERSPLSPPEVEKQSLSLPSLLPSPPKQQQELSPILLPSLSQQDQLLPPPPHPAKIDLPTLLWQQNQPPPPLPVQAPSLVLCPVPLRCYRPPLPPPQPPIQRPSPFVSPALVQNNQPRYVCSECGKVFPSYQALGGHKTSHRKRHSENSASASAAVVTGAADQNKPHTCSVCHKSFAMGQALGGHMRAHFEGKSFAIMGQTTAESRPVAAQSSSLPVSSTAVGLGIDLNLPAMPEEEAESYHPAPAAATSRPLCFISFF